MAYSEKSVKEDEARDINLKWIVDTANKSDYARAKETVVEVKKIFIEEKQRSNGIRSMGSLEYIEGKRGIVIGDLHGDEGSLVKILKETDFVERVKKGEKLVLVFLGDYIDVGPESVEVLNIILELKRNFKDNVVMLRGDHEVHPTSPNFHFSKDFLKKIIGHESAGSEFNQEFLDACNKKYGKWGSRMYEEHYEVFGMLPLAAKSANGILFVHGGVGKKTSEGNVVYGGEEAERDIVLNEPKEGIRGTERNSDKGFGESFGEDVADEALGRMGCKAVIVGHVLVKEEKVEMFNGKLLVVNSNAIIGLLANKKFAVGYAEISLEDDIENLKGAFHRI